MSDFMLVIPPGVTIHSSLRDFKRSSSHAW